ncbi:MAG TPA: group 1 glycosyl transferase [Candidatus Omnitrophica bacterium]|nr:group 1 glycosyl transferase [Candidatus Omnitrophota bacterium]
MKVLFWVPYPTQGPSNRFRVEQYLPYLASRGIEYCLRPFWQDKAYAILFENGHYLKKIYYFVKGTLGRFKDLVNLSDYDIIFVHREAYPIGGALLESLVFKKKPLIYDFDDALFLTNPYSSTNRIANFLKSPGKTAKILKISSIVIAGNSYLKEYAMRFNKNATVIHTPIDSDRYAFSQKPINNSKVVIGWIGTYASSRYLGYYLDLFGKLIEKYGSGIEIRLVGSLNHGLKSRQLIYKKWALEEEVNDLQDFDIGIMPVVDDDWGKGKCAFKIIQYMAVGASVVASPIGMNKEIIRDGENGFLASGKEEWRRKISALIENRQLRNDFSLKGRETVEKFYSVKVMAPQFAGILERTYENRP